MSSPPIDPKLLGTIVHDLRNPLNVIQLSARMIDQTKGTDNAELDEDLSVLRQNTQQLELMLQHLGDYCRQYETSALINSMRFGTERLVLDVIELQRDAMTNGDRDRLTEPEINPTAPKYLDLDLGRARLALSMAVRNALVATPKGKVRILVQGDASQVTFRVRIDEAPRSLESSIELRSDVFERLLPVAAERRAVDLAIVARVSELFGGSARLESEGGVSSSIVLNWPVTLNDSATSPAPSEAHEMR